MQREKEHGSNMKTWGLTFYLGTVGHPQENQESVQRIQMTFVIISVGTFPSVQQKSRLHKP